MKKVYKDSEVCCRKYEPSKYCLVQYVLGCQLTPGSVSYKIKDRFMMRDERSGCMQEGVMSDSAEMRRREQANTLLPLLCTIEFIKQKGIIKKHTEE